MAMPNHEQIRQLPDFATSNRWDIDIILPAAINFNKELITVRSQELSGEPKMTTSEIEINIRGMKIFQPGSVEFSNELTIKSVETDDYQLADMCQQWTKLNQNARTKYSSPRKDTQGTLIITKFNRQLQPVRRYKLIGAWLKDYSGLGVFTNDEQLINPDLVFKYDYFEEDRL